MKKTTLLICLLAASIISCKKEKEPEIKSYVSKMLYDNTEISFSMDDKNRIISINDAGNLIVNYTYTGDNITRIRYEYPSEGETIVYDISYSGNNPLEATKKFSSTHSTGYTHTFKYNISSEKVSSIDISDNGQKVDQLKFTYSGDNITKVESGDEYYEYTLGTDNSAFVNSLRSTPLIENEPVFLFNKSAITKERNVSGSFVDETTYQYTYEGGYPVSAKLVNTFGNQSVNSTITYEYVKK